MRCGVTSLLLLLATPVVAQTAIRPVRIAAPLVDLVIVSDSTCGTQVMAAPGLGSASGNRRTTVDNFAIDLVQLDVWLPAAQRLLDSARFMRKPTTGTLPGARLVADRGKSSITLGYDRTGRLDEEFTLTLSSVSGRPAWRAPLPDSTVSALLHELAASRASSRLVSLPDSNGVRPRLSCEVDEVPVMTRAPSLIRAFKTIRFEPGRRNGEAVPTLVFQPITFKSGR